MTDEILTSVPLIPTIAESLRQNYTVKNVVTLGCHCLMSYAQFRTNCEQERCFYHIASCQKTFIESGMIDYFCGQIARLASESVLVLELSVVSTYCSSGKHNIGKAFINSSFRLSHCR